MNDAQVKQFLMIAKYMNMSRAAEELFISQPALSASLSKTEKELGVKLFYRDGKKLILSHAGETLLSKFELVKSSLDSLQESADALKTEKTDHTLRVPVAFSINSAMYYTLEYFSFMHGCPGYQMEEIMVSHDQNLMLLKSGQVALSITYPPLADPEISSFTLLSVPIGLVVSPKHALAGRTSLAPGDLDGMKIYMNSTGYFRSYVENLLGQCGIAPELISFDNTLVYYRMISDNRSSESFVTICEKSFYDAVYGADYRFLPISDNRFIEKHSLSWLRKNRYDIVYRDLMHYIQTEYGRYYSFRMKTEHIYYESLSSPEAALL